MQVGLDLQWNLNEQTAFNQVKANQLDEGPLPAAEVQGVAQQYGVNKSRFWTKPVNCTGYLPLNMANPLFKDNLRLRQAINSRRANELNRTGLAKDFDFGDGDLGVIDFVIAAYARARPRGSRFAPF